MVRLRGPKSVIKSAKLHPAEAEKLERSGRNAREAIEFHNMVTLTPIGSLEIDIHFLKKEYEDVKYYLIALEKKIEDKQKKLDEIRGVQIEETPADKLDELVDDFVRMYHLNSFYDEISVEEAIDMAHVGLGRRAEKIGFTFDDVKEAIMRDFGSKTRKLYDFVNDDEVGKTV